MENATKKQSSIIAIIVMMFLFAMISFVTNLAAPFGLIWGNQYSWAGMMGNMMNFLAYLFMGIPAGIMLTKIGYKKTSILAMAVGFIGLGVQYVSSIVGADTAVFTVGGQPVMLNLIIYLLGAFICGFCVCMLNTVVNPMLNMLGGGGNRGNQLIQTGGSLNSLSATLTPLFVGMLIGNVTKDTAMSDVSPLLFIAMGVFAVSILVIAFATIPEPHLQKAGEKKEVMEHSPLAFRHTMLGVIAIFFYVGIEVGVPNTANIHFSEVLSPAVAGSFVGAYWFCMLVGRLVGGAIGAKVSSKSMLTVTAAVAALLVLGIIFVPADVVVFGAPLALVLVSACGLCTSVMWGSIFNLATEGLGKYTATASGIFMTLVCGGGIIPFFQNLLADKVGSLQSYWLIIICLAYLVFYAAYGSKNVNKDIKVD